MIKGYIGTYDTPNTKGIYQFNFDEQSGKVFEMKSFYPVNDAKCVVLAKDKLIITMNKDSKSGIALLNKDTAKLLDEALYENKTPCFIKYSGGYVYTANYHDGVVMVYKLQGDKLTLIKQITIQEKAGCHQVILYGDYILVPCLLLDEIRIFKRSEDFKFVKVWKFPQKTGPRHGVFNKEYNRFYLVSELSNEFFAYSVNDLNFELITKINLLEKYPTEGASSAAIRLTKDENYIYISTRGADLLSVIKVKDDIQLSQQIKSGIHPRDFLLSYDEQYLLCVNRDSDNLIVYKLDRKTRMIQDEIADISVPHGVGIALENIEL